MKATLNIEFDTAIKRDTTKLEQIANIINDNSTLCSNTSNSDAYEMMTKQITDLKNQKEDLEKEIKRYNDQIKKEYSRIDKLNQDLDDKQNEIKQLNQQILDKDKKIKETEDYYDQIIKEEEEKYRKLQRESINDLNKKTQEINELKKKLEIYGDGANNIGEEKFYNIDSNNLLIETMDDKAPYVAKAVDNEKSLFQFNINSGPIKEACNSNQDLLIYCEIIEREENAGAIKPGKWGTALRNTSGDLIVETKAQIKLTRM